MNEALTELDRRLANIVRLGAVKEIDAENARVKVEMGDVATDWLPWGERNAGPGRRTWSMPDVGEQVLVFAPSGDLAQAVVGPSVFQESYGAPAANEKTYRDEFADGAYLQYDREGHHWQLDVPSAGSITLRIGDTTLKLENGKATLTTPELLVDSPMSTFTGHVLVQGLLEYTAGMVGSGGTGATASITGEVDIIGNVTTTGNLQNNGHDVGSTHRHTNTKPGTPLELSGTPQ